MDAKLRLGITYRFADYVIAQTDEMNIGLVKELMLSETLVHTIPNVIDNGILPNVWKLLLHLTIISMFVL